jgi:hypothetical protein
VNGCPAPGPSRMTVHRILVRHGLVDPTVRRRRRQDYRRWQRGERPASRPSRATGRRIGCGVWPRLTAKRRPAMDRPQWTGCQSR